MGADGRETKSSKGFQERKTWVTWATGGLQANVVGHKNGRNWCVMSKQLTLLEF